MSASRPEISKCDRPGSVWENEDCGQRVLRGGSWDVKPRYLRSAFRFRFGTGARLDSIGFRVARTLAP